MASSTAYSDLVGSAAPSQWQGDMAGFAAPAGRNLRRGTLVTLRWVGLLCQTVGVVTAALNGGAWRAVVFCMVLVLLGAVVNLAVGLAGPRSRLVSDFEGTLQLVFDVLQLSALIYFVGGAANPFMVMLVAPAIVAAASLPWRSAATVGGLAIASALGLAFSASPFPVPGGVLFTAPFAFRIAAALAIGVSILFTAGYALLAARQAARMELALHVTQSVLAREQRLSALGGLAAAAAHELGTPLATISVVARELARDAHEDVRDDARLLLSQAERCREILRRLTETPDTDDAVHARMSLLQLLNEVIEPYAEAPVHVEAVVTGAPGAAAPDIRRMPEVLRALTSLVDNAVDFAVSEVLITARFDENAVAVEVRDDGPGFAPEVLGKLGLPYVTSRPAGEGSNSDYTGMGLGFFIAKTLLERTGAQLHFSNGVGAGAVVAASWPRLAIEAPSPA